MPVPPAAVTLPVVTPAPPPPHVRGPAVPLLPAAVAFPFPPEIPGGLKVMPNSTVVEEIEPVPAVPPALAVPAWPDPPPFADKSEI